MGGRGWEWSLSQGPRGPEGQLWAVAAPVGFPKQDGGPDSDGSPRAPHRGEGRAPLQLLPNKRIVKSHLGSDGEKTFFLVRT